MPSIARHHAEWLSLIEVSGPFLSLPVLMEIFPGGLDLKTSEGEMRRRLRLAYEEWADNQLGTQPDPAIHTQWLRFVLEEVLEMQPDAIREGQQLPPELQYKEREHGETLRPTLAIRSPYQDGPSLLVLLYPRQQHLEKVVPDRQWQASPATRMLELLRQSGMRLGLVTNGRKWMLVYAPPGESAGYYTWDAEMWLEEPLTLRAFYSLLGMARFFNVPTHETLEAMLTRSAQKQQEVTDQLGEQVRRAVNMIVRTLDRLDKDNSRALLHSIGEGELYEAALTVMMRLVFLLSAEERGMLLLSHELYDSYYAVSTLLQSLQESADAHGEEVLGMRFDAWSRLLALFRMVYGGVDYIDLRLPAYGGRLFDPDRFPFLEGRQPGTSWRDVPAAPLLIDNRTVLHLLHALQYLHMRVPGGAVEPRRLSFQGLDIEQIGHVYEGLLDHTARRAATAILGLQGTSDSEPEITLPLLKEKASSGAAELLDFLRELTGRSAASLQKGLASELTKSEERSRLVEACDNNAELYRRVLPYVGLLRRDTFGNYVLVTPGSVYVTHGSDRRSTGTHYTPRSLTEPIVQHALDPLVYTGPAEGWPQEQWKLHSAPEILALKICDMAMGSGAFLVQSCRYLSEKLVEAWEKAEQDAIESAAHEKARKPLLTIDAQPSQGRPGEELLPVEREERLALARRLVSERCLYGVDKNPMAVEMAKLSLWLITIAKNQPFTFLDHALRCGDSLLGIDTRQLLNWSLDARTGQVTQMVWIHGVLERAVATALKLRRQISALHDHDVRDTEAKTRMLHEADEAMSVVKLGADLLTGMALSDARRRDALQNTRGLDYSLLLKAYEEARNTPTTDVGWQPIRASFEKMRTEVDELLKGRESFHWHLEFPEVFTGVSDEAGFDAIVGNPPFQGGSLISGELGTDYREYLVNYIAGNKRGNADLCAFFFLNMAKLVKHEGMGALLATNTIAQGDTREIGLDQLVSNGWTIIRAIPSRHWPGDANLEVSYIWLRYGDWKGQLFLDGFLVSGISPNLSSSGRRVSPALWELSHPLCLSGPVCEPAQAGTAR